jgi:hypothetical protein
VRQWSGGCCRRLTCRGLWCNLLTVAVEWGLLSTTTARATALQYSGADKKRGAVLQIEAGRVDLGACIMVRGRLIGCLGGSRLPTLDPLDLG